MNAFWSITLYDTTASRFCASNLTSAMGAGFGNSDLTTLKPHLGKRGFLTFRDRRRPAFSEQEEVVTATIRWFVVVMVLALSAALPRLASAQSTSTPASVNNEYRVTLVTTRPAAEREMVIYFFYLGVVDSPAQQVSLLY